MPTISAFWWTWRSRSRLGDTQFPRCSPRGSSGSQPGWDLRPSVQDDRQAPRTRRHIGPGHPERLVIAYDDGACRSSAACAASSGGTDGVVDTGKSTLDWGTPLGNPLLRRRDPRHLACPIRLAPKSLPAASLPRDSEPVNAKVTKRLMEDEDSRHEAPDLRSAISHQPRDGPLT